MSNLFQDLQFSLSLPISHEPDNTEIVLIPGIIPALQSPAIYNSEPIYLQSIPIDDDLFGNADNHRHPNSMDGDSEDSDGSSVVTFGIHNSDDELQIIGQKRLFVSFTDDEDDL